MNVRLLILTVATLALFTIACNNASNSRSTNAKPGVPLSSATPDEFAPARANFKKNCELCHGANGEGGRVKLEDGTKLKVPTFHEGHALHHPDSDFVKQITKGGDGMPAFKEKLTPEQINDLVRFIRHEFQGGITPPADKMKSMSDMKEK
jgi:mono/diheme cytochrome c family protein